jgi:hypothetical protein
MPGLAFPATPNQRVQHLGFLQALCVTSGRRSSGVPPVDDEVRHPISVTGGVRNRDPPAPGHPQERKTIKSVGVYNRLEVGHPRLEREILRFMV